MDISKDKQKGNGLMERAQLLGLENQNLNPDCRFQPM